MPSDHDSTERLRARISEMSAQIEGMKADASRREQQLAELGAELAGLHGMLEHRAVIEQAKGVLMHSMGCGPDAAFDLLVVQSQAQNRKLWEVARELADAQDHQLRARQPRSVEGAGTGGAGP